MLEGAGEVRFALLFGSRGRGLPKQGSDRDVAVWTGLADRGARHQLRLQLMADLGQVLKSDRVDLVVLDDAPSLLCYEVLRTGVPVGCRDPGARAEFFVRILRRYFDEQPMRRLHAQALRRRIPNGEGIRSTERSPKAA